MNDLLEVERRTRIAEHAFEQYEFGDDISVTDQGTWDTNDFDDFIKIAAIEIAVPAPQYFEVDRISFHVRFDALGSVAEVYALLVSTGSEIGCPASQ